MKDADKGRAETRECVQYQLLAMLNSQQAHEEQSAHGQLPPCRHLQAPHNSHGQREQEQVAGDVEARHDVVAAAVQLHAAPRRLRVPVAAVAGPRRAQPERQEAHGGVEDHHDNASGNDEVPYRAAGITEEAMVQGE